jgi:hypothetical protein
MSSMKRFSWRRIAVWMVVIGAASAVFFVLLPRMCDGRLEPPPDPDGRMLRAVLASSEASDAAHYSPARLRAARSRLDIALAEINRQRAYAWLNRDYRPAQELMVESATAALGLYREVIDRRIADQEAARGMLQLIEQELATQADVARHTAPNTRIRHSLALTEMRRREATDYLADGRYAAAVHASRAALDALMAARQQSRSLLARFDDPANLDRWRVWIHDAVALSRRSGLAIVVVKAHHRLDVYERGLLVRSMAVDLGANSIYPKLHEGDRATPEGRYRVTQKKGPGHSIYGLALLIDYPNAEDRRRFQENRRQGLIPPRAGIGGLIEIHGHGGRGYDWTDGCVAPVDEDMAWLFKRSTLGTPVVIVGSDGSASPIHDYLNGNSSHEQRPDNS